VSELMVIVRGYLPTYFPDDGIVSLTISFVFPGLCDILYLPLSQFPLCILASYGIPSHSFIIS